ncbi:MAG: hypothetical protein KIT31_20400 [Deltaproteobacteria bacterium]|nr:hypothetical protein [Deltaproteobacteria bacterium]
MSVSLLDRLLVAWDGSRDAVIEDAIVRIGRAVARPRGMLLLEGSDERRWYELAATGDAGDVDRLLDVPWRTTALRVCNRVAELAKRPPDPRIARRLVACARHFRSKADLAVHEAIAPVLRRIATPSIVPHLDALSAGRTYSFTQLYDGARAACAAIAPTAPADAKLLDEVRARTGDGDDLAALWADVGADPSDLARRAVLADALDVANDPRGEFIQLQLALAAGTADRKARSRCDRLAAVHADMWLGALPLIEMRTARFARGFPVAIETRAGRALTASLDRSEWATVEELTLLDDCLDLGEVMRRLPLLRRIGLRASASLEGVTGTYPNIESAACLTSWYPRRDLFPNLRVAGGNWNQQQLASIHKASTSLGLDAVVHFGVAVGALREAAAMRATGPRELRFAFQGQRGFQATGWRVRVRRGSPVADLSLDAPTPRTDDVAHLPFQLADAGVRQLRVYLHPDVGHRAVRESRAAFDRVARYRGVVVTSDGAPIDLGAPVG